MDRQHAAFFSAFVVGLTGIAVATIGNLNADLGCTIACVSFVLLCIAFVSIVLVSRTAVANPAAPVSSVSAHALLQDSVIKGAVHRARAITRARKLVDFATGSAGSDSNTLYYPFVGSHGRGESNHPM